jgi:hypothetical protein
VVELKTLKSVDVVTHMQNNFNYNNIARTPGHIDYDLFIKLPPMIPFDDVVVAYLNALSKALNKDSRTRIYPDVATFSFFCRKANILQIKKKFVKDDEIKLGRGLIFHIAPSNVPVNFAYSLIVGLLSGNSNIVRVPSKKYDQVEIIIDAINTLDDKGEHPIVSERIVLVSYDRSHIATKHFSSVCDVRIIWGGDETIRQIRENALPPRAFDITFADRYSICLINADKFAEELEPHKIAIGFYNDTYLFDQNACTSPHLVLWVGSKDHVKKAQQVFWRNLKKIVESDYEVQPVIAVDKLTSFFNQAIQMRKIKLISKGDNLLWRVSLDKLSNDIDDFRCNSGYFSEYHVNDIDELSSVINNKYQTLAYYGFSKEQMADFILKLHPFGVDRIVPIGRTTDFSLIWDGYNLINSLSRIIEIS